MSTYELDDDLVRRWTANPTLTGEDGLEIREALKKQLPLPAPQNIGSIVETMQFPNGIARQFQRYAYEVSTMEPWIEVGDRDLSTYRTDQIGRITKVLSEGVDL